MLREEPPGGRRIEIAESGQAARRELVLERWAQLVTQPRGCRADEPALGRPEMLRRQAGSEHASKQPFRLPTTYFHAVGQRENTACQLVVHERHTDLERVGHR